MKAGLRVGFLIFSTLFVSELAFAHARFVNPVPRIPNANIKEATAPCGAPRTATPTAYKPGQIINIVVEETINHPGFFAVRFSQAGDLGFAANELVRVVDDVNLGTKTIAVPLPNVECTDCTLQMVQIMTDRNPPTNYYSCVDIQLSAAAVPPPVIPPPVDPPPDGGGSDQSSLGNGDSANNQKSEMGGCGAITGSGGGPSGPWGMLALMFPLLVALRLRARSIFSI